MYYTLRYSPWMGRSWTLQEGALAQCVMFQCAGWTCPMPFESEREIASNNTQSVVEGLLSRSTSMQADEDQILANLSGLSANELRQYSRSDRVRAFIATKAEKLPLDLLLRRINKIPQKPREEWWLPDLDSRASFYSVGKESGVATLCERGVIIETCETSFWDPNKGALRTVKGLPAADEGGILACSIELIDREGKVFWVTHLGRSFWISLDLDIRQITDGAPKSQGITLTLLLPLKPWKTPCLNSQGFIGRGLCLTRTREAVLHINHPEHPRVWPSLYNCALTMGLMTSLSAMEFADKPTTQAHELDQMTFLINSDIASWPRLQIVRSGEFVPVNGNDPAFYILYGVFASITSAYVVIWLSLSVNSIGHIPIYTIFIMFLTFPWIYVYFRLGARRRMREYKRWVNSFALADDVQ